MKWPKFLFLASVAMIIAFALGVRLAGGGN